MKKANVKVGGTYLAKVTGKLVDVKITGESQYGGWDAVNNQTGKKVRIKTAQRLRPMPTRKPKMNDKQLAAVLAEKGYEAMSQTDRAVLRKKLGVTATDVARVLKPELLAKPPEPEAAKPKPSKAKTPDAKPAKPEAKPKAKAKAAKKARGMSGLDAAAKVLAEAGEPLHCKVIVERALAKDYWTTNGQTPHATLYAAMLREIQAKGDESRFVKADRGLFALAKKGS